MERSLLAGVICGTFIGILFVGAGTAYLLLQPAFTGLMERITSRGMGLVRISILAAIASMGAWITIGLLAGLVYSLLSSDSPSAGLGSPNAAYTEGIALMTIAVVLASAIRRRYFGVALVAGLAFAAVFGWLLPWLAS